MTLQEFIEKYNGKYVEVAGSANAQNQCVDLANLYIRDVLNLPIIEWTNAKDFPSKGGDDYDWIPNTPTGVPSEGDLVVWGGTYGHIAVFIEGNASSFRSLDQNYPVGSPCHVQGHTYTSTVMGWMHPKSLPPSDQVCMSKDKAQDFERVKECWNQVRKKLNVEDSVTVVLAEIDKLVGYEDKVVVSDRELSEAQTEINDLKGMLDHYQKINLDLTEKATDLSERADELEKDYVKTSLNYREAMGRIEALQKLIERPALTGWKKLIVDLISKL